MLPLTAWATCSVTWPGTQHRSRVTGMEGDTLHNSHHVQTALHGTNQGSEWPGGSTASDPGTVDAGQPYASQPPANYTWETLSLRAGNKAVILTWSLISVLPTQGLLLPVHHQGMMICTKGLPPDFPLGCVGGLPAPMSAPQACQVFLGRLAPGHGNGKGDRSR